MWRMYRNKVNRDSKQLERKYYKRAIQDTKSANPSKWWRGVKHLAGEPIGNNNHVTTMVNELYGGDMNPIVKEINGFSFLSITTHLIPLIQIDFGPLYIPDKYHISVEQTKRALFGISCKNHHVWMKFQIGCSMTLQTYLVGQCVQYGITLLGLNIFQKCRNLLT